MIMLRIDSIICSKHCWNKKKTTTNFNKLVKHRLSLSSTMMNTTNTKVSLSNDNMSYSINFFYCCVQARLDKHRLFCIVPHTLKKGCLQPIVNKKTYLAKCLVQSGFSTDLLSNTLTLRPIALCQRILDVSNRFTYELTRLNTSKSTLRVIKVSCME